MAKVARIIAEREAICEPSEETVQRFAHRHSVLSEHRVEKSHRQFLAEFKRDVHYWMLTKIENQW